MALSAISSSTNPQQATPADNGWQQFMTMADAIQSGDIGSAQQALSSFTQSQAGQVVAKNPNSPLSQTLGQIEQSLQSGDVSGAQQALSSLRPHHHRHHHHAAPGQPTAPTAPTAPASASDPNAPGANVDVTA